MTSYYKSSRLIAAAFSLLMLVGQAATGQIVINEIVDDERLFDSGATADTREYIELYNAGNAAVDIGGYAMKYWSLETPGSYLSVVDTIPAGTMLAAGDYYVIGATGVPNVDLDLGTGELFPDLNTVFELRDASDALVDALGLETFRTTELQFAGPGQIPQIGGGVWGQVISSNAVAPNRTMSIGRYLDGRDTNSNGRDFGFMPLTPGTTNNVAVAAIYTVPNADPLTVGTTIDTDYASFVLPRVIDPTVVSGFNPNAIPASPQGGKAIVAYDETGGGNAIYSGTYANKFELSAFIDTRPLNLATQATVALRTQSEATIYGIGTTDPFFGTPDAAGALAFGSSANGSTGLGWYIQRVERFADADFDNDSDVDGSDFLTWQRNVGTTTGATNATGDANADGIVNRQDLASVGVGFGAATGGDVRVTKTILMLIDMNDGGDGVVQDQDWQVKAAIDLTGVAQGWHNLSIDYNPATGAVIAKYDGQTFNFTTTTGLVGNFYVGYRENLPGAGNGPARPPTYDLIATAAAGAVPEPAATALAGWGALALAGALRRRRADRRSLNLSERR